jgi:hypothetical protein
MLDYSPEKYLWVGREYYIKDMFPEPVVNILIVNLSLSTLFSYKDSSCRVISFPHVGCHLSANSKEEGVQ